MNTKISGPLLALLLLAAACGSTDDTGDSTTPPPGSSALVSTSWVATALFIGGVPVQLLPNAAPSVSFADDGTLGGSTGCNSFFGTVTVDGGSIQIRELGMTEIGCEPPLAEQERFVMDVLVKADTWSFVDDVLTIGASDGSGSLELVAPPPIVNSPIAGTNWLLDAVVMGDAVSTPVLGTAVTLVADEGNIEGSTGCNDYAAEATIAPPSITVSNLSFTERACAAEIMAQEAFVLDVLRDAATIEVTGDTLVLTAVTTGLIFRAS